MQTNPYPKEILDEASGITVASDNHKIWQQGYEAGWKEAADIVQKVNAEASHPKKFRRLVLAAFVPQEEK